MKLKTSFSKLTTFRKDITRFAPVWIIYMIVVLMVLVGQFAHMEYSWVAYRVIETITSFGIVNLVYAAVIAAMLFGDLYNTRMCYSLHTLPQRRESWLLSHLAAGVLFALVPNLVAMAMMCVALESYWFLGLYWLLAVMLQFLFFYGLAVVSALLVGNRFAMLAVYAGLNFVSMLAYWLVLTVYMPMLEGVVLEMTPFVTLCPVVRIYDFGYFEFEAICNAYSSVLLYSYKGPADGWGYLSVLAVIGLALMAFGVLLYRWRHLESAGDFIAFPKLNGPSCIIMTLCVAGVAALIGDEMLGGSFLLWFAVGLVVGWFGSRMLLERRLKVFRPKAFMGLGILAAILTGSFLLIAHDVFNIQGFVPEVSDVKSVTIANHAISKYDNVLYGNQIRVTLTEKEEIEDILEAHEDILQELDQPITTGTTYQVTIIYKLKDGRTVQRYYRPAKMGESYEVFQRYFNSPENVLGFGGQSWESFVASVEHIQTGLGELPKGLYEKMLEALREDCARGAVSAEGMKDSVTWIEIRYRNTNGIMVNRSLQVGKNATNTLAVLNDPQNILGLADAQRLLKGMLCMVVDGRNCAESHWPGLIEALLADCASGGLQTFAETTVVFTVEFTVEDVDLSHISRYLYISSEATNTIAYLKEHNVYEPLTK